MSLKHANAAAILALTTGAGLVIGTNVDITGVYIGSAASTVTIKGGADGTASYIEVVGNVSYYPPIAVDGPVTATSSGGTFYVAYVPR
jgi:hypothetical protein